MLETRASNGFGGNEDVRMVSSMLLSLGISCRLRGYYYLRYAVLRCKDEELLPTYDSICRELADIYHTDTTCVDAAMRHAIRVSKGTNSICKLNEFFNCSIFSCRSKIGAYTFIALLTDILYNKDEQCIG